MKLKKIYILGFIFFLFNTTGIPAPLTYTNLLSLTQPNHFFKLRNLILYGVFFIISFFYFGIHFYLGVEMKTYITSFLYTHLLCISTLIAYNYIKQNKGSFIGIFEWVAKGSFILFLISIPLYFTPLKTWVWQIHNFNIEMMGVPRYQGLSYEPSYYAFVLSPVFIFFFLKLIFDKKKRSLEHLIYVSIPFLFTLSLGVFGAFFIAINLSILFASLYYKKIKTVFFIAFFGVILVGFITSLSDNLISRRLVSILKGEDGSVKGRTVEAFYLAHQLTKEKSILFGIGLGQIKILGEKVIRPYYNYPPAYKIINIPNASAETLAIFGYSGLLLRLMFQLFLFVYFKVYRNYFSLVFFLFVFIYQFTGSFITSTAEYIIWIFSIVHLFPEYEIKNDKITA